MFFTLNEINQYESWLKNQENGDTKEAYTDQYFVATLQT
jgi:hypothetical protein